MGGFARPPASAEEIVAKGVVMPSCERLHRYLGTGRLHPALLFVGTDAPSKRQVLKDSVRALFCERRPAKTFTACGACRGCKKLESGHHPDFLEFPEPEGEPIKIESVREVTLAMETAPAEAPLRIAFIDECHRMTAPAANALLKSLEEPKPDRYFWLASTQPASLLPTVRSRCVSFRLGTDGDTEQPPPEMAQRFAAALGQVRNGADVAALVDGLGSKEAALDWLHWLRAEVRETLVAPKAESPLADRALVDLFRVADGISELEDQLRSNASWGLLLGAFVRERLAAVPR